jgi:Zn ribbon nucleic-acid-binding protein
VPSQLGLLNRSPISTPRSHAYPVGSGIIAFATEADCRAYWIEARWGGKPACARCNSTRVWAERDGFLFECAPCGHQTSLTSGTMLQKTRKPLKACFRAARDPGAPEPRAACAARSTPLLYEPSPLMRASGPWPRCRCAGVSSAWRTAATAIVDSQSVKSAGRDRSAGQTRPASLCSGQAVSALTRRRCAAPRRLRLSGGRVADTDGADRLHRELAGKLLVG